MGSSDPDSAWVQRHRAFSARARREHAAEASGHLGMFEYTPGSQTIAPRALDPFLAFDDAWFRARGRAEETFEGVSNRAIQLFAQARSIAFTPPLRERPVGGRWIQHATETGSDTVEPLVEARVDLGGYAFAATGATPLDALDALAARVCHGVEGAVGVAAPDAPRAPSALERAWEAMSPELRAAKEVYSYMIQRRILFTRSRDRGLEFHLTDHDFVVAQKVGLEIPGAPADMDPVAFFHAVGERTKEAELDSWEGVSKNSSLPGEGMDAFDRRVGSLERIRTDRYVDDGPSKATAAHAAQKAERDAGRGDGGVGFGA